MKENTFSGESTNLIVLLFVFCWSLQGCVCGSDSPTDVAGIEPNLLDAVATSPEYQGWRLVPVAQLEGGTRSMVLVWPVEGPGMQPGRDIIHGITFERSENGVPVRVGEPIKISEGYRGDELRKKVSLSLANKNIKVRQRKRGLPLDEIGPAMAELPNTFSEARGDKNWPVAIDAATRYFGLEIVHPSDLTKLAETAEFLLLFSLRSEMRFKHIKTAQDGDFASLTLQWVYSGTSGRQFRRIAQKDWRNPDRWTLKRR